MFPNFYPRFAANAGIVAILGNPLRFYRHGSAPQATSTSAPDSRIYATQISPDLAPENHLSGTPPVDRVRHTVSVWGANTGAGMEEAETLARLIRDELEPDHHVETVRDMGRDFQTQRYRFDIDVTVWNHRTA